MGYDAIPIPAQFSYQEIKHLSQQSIGLLYTIKPLSLGQALRIPNVPYEDRYLLTLFFLNSYKTDGWIHDAAI